MEGAHTEPLLLRIFFQELVFQSAESITYRDHLVQRPTRTRIVCKHTKVNLLKRTWLGGILLVSGKHLPPVGDELRPSERHGVCCLALDFGPLGSSLKCIFQLDPWASVNRLVYIAGTEHLRSPTSFRQFHPPQ